MCNLFILLPVGNIMVYLCYVTYIECLARNATKLFNFSKNATKLTFFLPVSLNLFIIIKNATVTGCSQFKGVEAHFLFQHRAKERVGLT